jgi:putative ABC transport system substrate-binding protein
MQYAERDPEGQIRAKAFSQELQKLGWKVGVNLRIDYRWAGGNRDRFRLHAADLVKLKEELVVAVSTPAVRALRRESLTIPIVFSWP